MKQLQSSREKPKSNNTADHSAAIDAAVAGLTRLGPSGTQALALIESLEQQGLPPDNMRDSRGWHLMLARLGCPIESIPKPPNRSNSEESFHNNLRQRLARYERTGERF